MTAAAVVARATWPGEARDEVGSGQGLAWALVVLLGLTIAAVGATASGRLRFRWCWVDLAVIALFGLVAASAGHAADGRVAQNLAWEWAGVGLAYLAVRWLARDALETRAWVAALVAVGFALSAYGAYQVAVLQPETRRLYLEDPAAALRRVGIPDDPIARRQFEDRLLGSREPTSTFALANSLAGALLVPLLVTCAGLLASGRRAGALAALALAAVMLPILVLTKGRGAYVGLAVGLMIVAAIAARDRRRLALAALGFAVVAAAIGAVLSVLGRLDPLVWNSEVLSESAKSLRYRGEYVVGAWRILTREPGVWWSGLGPGNFAGPYLRHKLETASEAIADPHNLFLEVWTTAGLPALLALVAALGLGLRDLLARRTDRSPVPLPPAPDRPPRLLAWGAAGMILALFLRPDLGPFATSGNPFEGDLARWAILLVGWIAGAWLARRMIRGLDDRALGVALAAGVLALVTDLLISGGIGFAPVALMLWTGLAAALNLRDDRACGRVRESVGRAGPLGALAAASALGGLFFGTIGPHLRAVDAMSSAEERVALARQAMQSPVADPYRRAEPHYLAAAEHLRAATRLDRLAAHPWIRWAWLELENWEASGRPADFSHLVWHRIEDMLTQAATPPRDPNNAAPAVAALPIAARVLAAPGWPEAERRRILDDRLRFARAAARLNPTSAMVQAAHAEAAWAARANEEGNDAARRALDLDRRTPHVDKKLTDAARARLETRLGRGKSVE